MHLTYSQRRRADNLFKIFKNKPPEYFLKNSITMCKRCEGTGLSGGKNDIGFIWDGTSFCEQCYGVGYMGIGDAIQIDDVTFLCRNCNGVGCGNCNKGVTDWVSHIMGR